MLDSAEEHPAMRAIRPSETEFPAPAPSKNKENRNRMSVASRRLTTSCRSMLPTILVSLNRIASVNDRSTCCHSDCCCSRLI